MTIANCFDLDDDDEDDVDDVDDNSSVLQIKVHPTLVVDCIMTLSGGETGQATLCREEMDLKMIMMIIMIMVMMMIIMMMTTVMIMEILMMIMAMMTRLSGGATGKPTCCR